MTPVTTIPPETKSGPAAEGKGLNTQALAPMQAQTLEAPVHLEPVKRKKTWGERRFDIVTYGGWALLGNEIASYFITSSVGKDLDGKPRFAHDFYKTKIEAPVAKLAKHFEHIKTPGLLRSMGDYIGGNSASPLKGAHLPRLPYLLVATIGGMLVVPFVKNREDKKGEIVRKLDQKHYGMERAKNDPKLLEAHKEMDDAPKQSWGSLWKGRVTTVISAAIADFAFGWPEALTTKLFKNNKTYQKFASLERISDYVAEKVTHGATARFNLSEHSQKRVMQATGTGTWLLTLSSSLTLLFYASSKLFAKKRDEKIERQVNGGDGILRDETISETVLETAMPKVAERPEPKVTNITRENTLSEQQSLAASV